MEPLFDPKPYAREHKPMRVEEHKLNEDDLWKYAVLANEIRLKILQKAKEEDDALSSAFEEGKQNRKSS